LTNDAGASHGVAARLEPTHSTGSPAQARLGQSLLTGSKKTDPRFKGFLPLLSRSVIAGEIPDGLQSIDGHLRQVLTGDAEVLFLVVGVMEGEADGALGRCSE